MCFLEAVDPFDFLGHVVAGRNDVRWSALSSKLLGNADLSSSLLSMSPWLGPLLLLSVCLPPPYTYHHTYHMHVFPTMHVCGVDNCICT